MNFTFFHHLITFKVIASVERLQMENRKQIEDQKSISKQIMTMKVDAVTSKGDDGKFEEDMKSLEEEHRYQLQHQAEMMCQVPNSVFIS